MLLRNNCDFFRQDISNHRWKLNPQPLDWCQKFHKFIVSSWQYLKLGLLTFTKLLPPEMPSLFPLGSSLVYFDSANNSTLFAHCISCKFGVPFVFRNMADYVLDNTPCALWCERYAIPHDDVINWITNLFHVTGPFWGESTGHRRRHGWRFWRFFSHQLGLSS